MKIQLNGPQLRLLTYLSKFECFITGGAIRNQLMGLPPSDVDISVKGSSEEVFSVIKKSFNVIDDKKAAEHGILRVITEDCLTDVCMTRIDIVCDGRHAAVEKENIPIEADLARRDLTINAIAAQVNSYGQVSKIIDPFNGMNHIKEKKLIFVGNAAQRIQEDYLRMLRYCRFGGLYSDWWYGLEDIQGIRELAPKIFSISKERIWAEIIKGMKYPHPDTFFRLLHKTDLLMYLLPNIYHGTLCKQNIHHGFETVWEHSLRVLKLVVEQSDDPMLRLAAMFHDIGKPRCISIDEEGRKHFYGHEKTGDRLAFYEARAIGASSKDADYLSTMVKCHKRDIRPDYTPRRIRKWARQYHPEERDGAIILSLCDYVGHKVWDRKYTLDDINICRRVLSAAIEGTILDNKTKIQIDGNDLIRLGLKPGPRFCEILQYIADTVVEQPELNTRKGCLLLALENIFKQRLERNKKCATSSHL